MISYDLSCYNGHTFKSWFLDEASYLRQQKLDLIACPDCGLCEVSNETVAEVATFNNLVPVESNPHFCEDEEGALYVIECDFGDAFINDLPSPDLSLSEDNKRKRASKEQPIEANSDSQSFPGIQG